MPPLRPEPRVRLDPAWKRRERIDAERPSAATRITGCVRQWMGIDVRGRSPGGGEVASRATMRSRPT
jgi:hypothetical protein